MKYLIPGKQIFNLGDEEFDLLVAISVHDKSLKKETWGLAGSLMQRNPSISFVCSNLAGLQSRY